MKLFDTAKNDYEQIEIGELFNMYVCGITPYDSAHLGHIFTFMTFDLLQRRIEDMGCKVQMVRNVTDVDDPIYKRAKELGISYTELAKSEVEKFDRVIERLNFKPLLAEPKASEYINDMSLAVEELINSGFAYHVDKDIYFDTSKYPEFGKFSGFSEKLRLAFMAERGGDPDRPGKRSPMDFLLWRAIDDENDPARWQSPVGTGRPGWHLECTVMSSEFYKIPFDLHGGGSDLIFPHHESEIAQSYGLEGKNPAKYWVHVSPMLYAGEKMSKSLGNLVFAEDLLKDHESGVIRLALMHYHHRIGGEWQPELLLEAENLLKAYRNARLHSNKQAVDALAEQVRSALDDDINTLEVIDALHRFAESCDVDAKSGAEQLDKCDKVSKLLGIS